MPSPKTRRVRRGNPHDALFRAVFSRKVHAADELRQVLPAAIRRRIDWSTLRLEDGHFVNEALGSRQSDLLFTASFEGEPTASYLLFEHQSTADRTMPFRLLRYMLKIWDRWLVEHRGARTLPIILPVVLSHAAGGWNQAVSLHQQYGLRPEMLRHLGAHVPNFSFVLDDLARRSDEALAGRTMQPLAILALLLLRHARDKQGLVDRLLEWGSLLKAVWAGPEGRESIALLVRYLTLANHEATRQTLVDTLEPMLGKGVSDVVMTEVQRMVRDGEARGKAEGKAEDLLAVLAARGLNVSNEQRARILACKDLALLSRWIVKAATAQSAGDALSEA